MTATLSPRPAVFLAAVLAFALLVIPDCCLNGSHAYGFGMSVFAPICSAPR